MTGPDSNDCRRRRRKAKAYAKSFIKRDSIKLQVAQEFGFTLEMIYKVAYKHYLDGDGDDYVCAGDLIMDLLDFEEVVKVNVEEHEEDDDDDDEEGASSSITQLSSSDFKLLQEETLDHWKRSRCAACIRNKCILFLPCTHLLYCENCANDRANCPVCDTIIESKIMVYIG